MPLKSPSLKRPKRFGFLSLQRYTFFLNYAIFIYFFYKKDFPSPELRDMERSGF